MPFDGDAVFLRIRGDYLAYRFSWSAMARSGRTWAGQWTARLCSPAVLGGFNYTGVYLGLYASSNGERSDSHADFDFFRYAPADAGRDDWYHRQRQAQAGGQARPERQ